MNDTSPEVVRQFLKFVYTDSFDDSGFRTVSQLLPLAEKYDVKKLSNECGQKMLQVWEIDCCVAVQYIKIVVVVIVAYEGENGWVCTLMLIVVYFMFVLETNVC